MRLNQVEVLVLDEADRMLDMGFIHDIRTIIAKLPKERQTLLFSATMPREIAELAAQMLRDPVRVAVTPVASTVERIEQRVIMIDKPAKSALLDRDAARRSERPRRWCSPAPSTAPTRWCEACTRPAFAAEAIHGNKSQNQRERVLGAFRAGKLTTLVATDIAARGIDVDGISHVINYDLPNIPESYVHRIGRTARAGADGIAISFCDNEEVAFLRDIEKLIQIKLPVDRATHQPARGSRAASPAAERGPQRAERKPPQRPAATAQWRRRQRPSGPAAAAQRERPPRQAAAQRWRPARPTAPEWGKSSRPFYRGQLT